MGKWLLGLVVLCGCGRYGFDSVDLSQDSDGGVGNAPDPVAATCAPGSPSGAVQAPILEQTLLASWDENWFASPALVDITGDGLLDIIAARHSVLYTYRHDGSPLWQTAWASPASDSPEHGNARMWSSAVVGDFEGDGDMEIAVGANSSSDLVNVAVYDHLGEFVPGFPVQFGGSDEVRSITAGDTDDDGVLEIIVNKTNDGPTTGVYELDGSMATGWPQVDASCNPPDPAEECWDFGGYNQNVAAGDIDGNGTLDVVSSYAAIGFGIFYGDGAPFATAPEFTDRVVTATEAYHDITLSQQGWGSGDRSSFGSSPPVVADIDGDGDMEIVLGADHGSSEDGVNRGVALWVVNPDLTRPTGWETPINLGAPLDTSSLGPNIVGSRPSPAVGDILPTPGLEIVIPGYDGNMHAYHSDGTVAWTYSFAAVGGGYNGASEPLLVDLNGDGALEVVFATYSSGEPRTPEVPAHLIILDANGNELHKVEISGRGSMAAPSIADLEGDGDLELVISLKDTLGGSDGGVQIWSLPGSSGNCMLWATGRGTPLRQGYVVPATR